MKSKRSANVGEYKHRQILVWRGLSYRYDKTFGCWRLVDKPAPFGAQTAIMEWQREGNSRWEVGHYRADSPVEALEAHNAALIELRSREAREAADHARSLREEVRRLRSKNLKGG